MSRLPAPQVAAGLLPHLTHDGPAPFADGETPDGVRPAGQRTELPPLDGTPDERIVAEWQAILEATPALVRLAVSFGVYRRGRLLWAGFGGERGIQRQLAAGTPLPS